MIDEAALRKAFVALQRRVEYLEAASGLFVPESALTERNGDPSVKFSPRDWHGENFVGKHFSQCSPDFLEVLAETLQWAAEHPKAGKEQYAKYNRLDAARARTWARVLRARGWTPPTAPERPAGRPTGSRRTGGGRPRRGNGETPAPDAPPPADPLPQHDTGGIPDEPKDDFFDDLAGKEDGGDDDWLHDEDDDGFDDDYFDEGGRQRETLDGMD